jgi:hypothetical protein
MVRCSFEVHVRKVTNILNSVKLCWNRINSVPRIILENLRQSKWKMQVWLHFERAENVTLVPQSEAQYRQFTRCRVISIHFHLFSFTSIYFHSIPFTSIHFHSLPLTFILFHSLPLIFIHFRPLPFTSIHFHLLSFTSIHFHLFSFTSIYFHLLSFTSNQQPVSPNTHLHIILPFSLAVTTSLLLRDSTSKLCTYFLSLPSYLQAYFIVGS